MLLILTLLALVSSGYNYALPCLNTYWYQTNAGYADMPSYSQYVDINGDGLTDFICAFVDVGNTLYKYFYINTGCGFVDQTKFNSSMYCTSILHNDNYKHLRKYALIQHSSTDQQLYNLLSATFGADKINVILDLFKSEGIDIEVFRSLTYQHFIDMGFGIGDILKLQKLQIA